MFQSSDCEEQATVEIVRHGMASLDISACISRQDLVVMRGSENNASDADSLTFAVE